MFRIRKIHDTTSQADRDALRQVVEIFKKQFSGVRKQDLDKLTEQLNDPLTFNYRSILFVAEDGKNTVRGFAMLLHMADVKIGYLEYISAAPGRTSGGVGGALYEAIREEVVSLKIKGLFFECSVDDADVIADPSILAQNIARLKFYERYGARPIINNLYATPIKPGDKDLYYLVVDQLGLDTNIRSKDVDKIVRAILERKYGELIDDAQIDAVATSFTDDPIQLRPLQYTKPRQVKTAIRPTRLHSIALVVNEGHSIHHVKTRGYVEAPVRIPVILEEMDKTGLFTRVTPRKTNKKYLLEVHDPNYVAYLRDACERLPPNKSIYPIIFPIRNISRPPKDFELQVGYYCMDTFTPLNRNAYVAAIGAVDCAMTAAEVLLEQYKLSYALIRPPGHHAERRAFGGFCYFNSSSVAANYLSKYGRVAILDVDFHHGNGTQDIFYQRNDVFTVSIHGHPSFAYPHFSGFKDEVGEGAGEGYNLNFPLAQHTTAEQYAKTLKTALTKIKQFKPKFLVIGLGLDTAKADPTGTWDLKANDFRANGHQIGSLGLPTLIVQEGGYRTRTLGVNARHFFEGLWQAFFQK